MRVYRLAGTPAHEIELGLRAFDGRPTIAVLAFEYLGEDADREHLVDGVAERS